MLKLDGIEKARPNRSDLSGYSNVSSNEADVTVLRDLKDTIRCTACLLTEEGELVPGVVIKRFKVKLSVV